LIAYGILEFRSIANWYKYDGDHIPDYVKYVELSPRGKALLRELSGS
jgi:hypothetical protein